MAEEVGAELNYNLDQVTVPFAGSINKSFVLGQYITDADLIINIAKLKTHGLTMMTGAVKNLFGAIPGLLKAEYHLRMPELADFSNMLLDLSLCVNPVLNIIDGVWGMEGEGLQPVQSGILAIYWPALPPCSRCSSSISTGDYTCKQGTHYLCCPGERPSRQYRGDFLAG